MWDIMGSPVTVKRPQALTGRLLFEGLAADCKKEGSLHRERKEIWDRAKANPIIKHKETASPGHGLEGFVFLVYR